jgi:hypothetical protein
MGFGIKKLPIDFQNTSVIQKMKEFVPDRMGVKACPFSAFDFGKIN